MKKTTNKQLIKLGVTQEQILKIVESTLNTVLASGNLISIPAWDGDEETTEIRFEDHKGREWVVYYFDGENEDTLFINSYKGEELEEVNTKSFKSIHATVKFLERLIG